VNALSLQRQENVSESLCNIRNVINKQGASLQALARAKEIMLSLASQEHLFSEADYPTPRPDKYAKVYLLRDDRDGAFSLNLVSSLPLGCPLSMTIAPLGYDRRSGRRRRKHSLQTT
jgi:predicted metal-dependent enzyme (double-stranded beta helix superfamily)